MNKALDYALKLLAKKDYTESEIRQKFERHQADSVEAEAALLFLKENSFIDDTRYAKNFRNSHHTRGDIRIKYELIKRGISDQIISDLLSINDRELQVNNAREVASTWLVKKSDKYEDKYKLKQHLIAKLGRQGFSYDIITQVVEDLIK